MTNFTPLKKNNSYTWKKLEGIQQIWVVEGIPGAAVHFEGYPDLCFFSFTETGRDGAVVRSQHHELATAQRNVEGRLRMACSH